MQAMNKYPIKRYMGFYTFTSTNVPRQTKEFHDSRWILNNAAEKKVDITVAIEIRGNHVEAVVNQAIHNPESRNISVLTPMHNHLSYNTSFIFTPKCGLVNERHTKAHTRRKKTCTCRLNNILPGHVSTEK